jgi:hypothetical protein
MALRKSHNPTLSQSAQDTVLHARRAVAQPAGRPPAGPAGRPPAARRRQPAPQLVLHLAGALAKGWPVDLSRLGVTPAVLAGLVATLNWRACAVGALAQLWAPIRL